VRHDHVEQPYSLLNLCHFTNTFETKQCVGVDMPLVLNHAEKTVSIARVYAWQTMPMLRDHEYYVTLHDSSQNTLANYPCQV
jgi:uncharacterized protein YfcZ (UPF0381/DUF406 family)